jgi:predicted O-methyltransferase YrrM
MSVDSPIREILRQHAGHLAATSLPERLLHMLCDDPRNRGDALRRGIDHLVRLLTSDSVSPAKRVAIIHELAQELGFATRLSPRAELAEAAARNRPPLERLRSWYPWPALPLPDLEPCETCHFLTTATTRTLTEVVRTYRPRLILEIGSWLGGTTRHLLECSEATVICVDPWIGSEEHQPGTRWHERDPRHAELLPRLFDQFVRNRWEDRMRIIPMRTTGVTGICLLRDFEVTPDLIFLDGAHDRLTVALELEAAAECYPGRVLVVDDYNLSEEWLHGLVRAVDEFAECHGYELIYCEGNAGVLLPPGRPARISGASPVPTHQRCW